MPETATDPDGMVHILGTDGFTVCGQNASGWSRFVTIAQRAGLVLFCEACRDAA